MNDPKKRPYSIAIDDETKHRLRQLRSRIEEKELTTISISEVIRRAIECLDKTIHVSKNT